MDEAERLRAKISEIQQRVAFQQALNAKMSERLQVQRERDLKIQREIRVVQGHKRLKGGEYVQVSLKVS